MKTDLIDVKEINKIVDLLKEKNVVAFPTETVFGLGVSVNSVQGLESIYDIKGRQSSKAITLMVASVEQARAYAKISDYAFKIMDTLMPGKLTIVLPKVDSLDKVYTAGLNTIGIRIPDSELVLELLQKVGPMWVTSANLSGDKDMIKAVDVYQVFDGKISAVVNQDAGNDKPSTVVLVEDKSVTILRQGSISKKEIMEAIV